MTDGRLGLLMRAMLCVLLLLLGAASAAADDTIKRLDTGARDAVSRRAQFARHAAPGRPQFDAARLSAIGADPVYQLEVDNATFYLSSPFALDASHQIAVTLIEVDAGVFARVLYRSNSQFSWRLCDAMRGRHIGKGYHEFDKQVPIPVTAALMRLADQAGRLRPVEAFTPPEATQHDLSFFLQQGLTIDGASDSETEQIVSVGNKYMTREYKEWIPADPDAFSIVEGELRTAGGGSVADPEKTKLPAQRKRPDFDTLVDSFEYRNPAYAAVTRGNGLLQGRVYLSHDGTVRYLFYEDPEGRVVLAGAEPLDAPINRLGLRSRYLDVRGMDAPLIEYAFQIPRSYGGRRQLRYKLNWPLVQKQPIIRLYLASRR